MELVRSGVSGEVYLPQVCNIAAGLNTNYYPTSFVLHDGLLWYADYECDVYRLVNRILSGQQMIHLETITPENWRLDLAVREDQRRFVSDRAGILARAYAYRENRSRAFVIYNNDLPIGMAMYYDLDDCNAYHFSQFFIDHRYQGNGLGYEASKRIIQMMKDDKKYDKVVLCYIDGDDAARKLYEKLGFKDTGEADGDEIIMELEIR
jgi:diamine N-acetyltransferase